MNLKNKLYIFLLVTFAVIIYTFVKIIFIPPHTDENLNNKNITFIISPNSSLNQIAIELHYSGILKNPLIFKILVKITGNEHKIKAGEYDFSYSNSMIDVLKKIKKGEFKKHKITIPEGYTGIEIAEFLHQKGIANKEKFLGLINDEKILKKYGIEAPSLEGYLFPDTYLFFKGISEEKIIKNMLNRFFTIFNADYEKKTLETGLTRHEVIILASIVEKEAMKENERAKIAAVFLNRLKKHIRLESCATVQYALKKHKDRLLEEDLKIESPYNTYLYHGLPVGPISNPGKASIFAVLYPDNVKYLYFVSRNDGSHEFSNTFKEHVNSKRKFIK